MVNARIIPGLAQECRCISKYVQYHIIRIETWWEIAMPYAPEHKQRTRGRIVEAASRLFKTHGYEGVGIDRIMAEAGLTRGGFYAHFEGKEALFAEVVGWLGPSARMRKRFSAEKGASGDSVLAFVRTYLSHAHRRDLANGCPLATLSVDIGRAGPAARRSYTQALRNAATRFAHGRPGLRAACDLRWRHGSGACRGRRGYRGRHPESMPEGSDPVGRGQWKAVMSRRKTCVSSAVSPGY
jgi:AcrR family transcriptional regulator